MRKFRRMSLGQANGLPKLRELQEEAATKRAQVEAMEKTLLDLKRELALLKGEPPPNDVGAISWYRRYWKWLVAGGVGTVVAGVIVAKKKKK